MKRFVFFLLSLLALTCVQAQNVSAKYYSPEIPVLTNRANNIVLEIVINSSMGGEVVNEFKIEQRGILPEDGIAARVFFSGTSSALRSRTPSQAMYEGVREIGGSQTFYCHPAYSIQKYELSGISAEMFFPVNTKLVRGDNYFWVSFQVSENTSLDTQFAVKLMAAKIDGKNVEIQREKTYDVIHRVGYGLRQSGDDGVHSYRIPGLATSNKGTLLAVYDARHQTNIDLQEDIDVGLSRSTNGGKTWEPMQIIMDMGEYNGLPQSQNGIGDPAILVDEKTNTAWVCAVWVHGLANARAWGSVKPGMTPEEGTGQLILVKSTDDGKTWSAPINITSMIKTPDIPMLLQGPGRGITMRDGTLVFPVQYKSIENKQRGEISIIYSKNGGETWIRAQSVPTEVQVSEPQIAEIAPGILMINARTSLPNRFVAVTSDLGKTWNEHETSGKVLPEPGCMGSILHINKENNSLGKDILLFSNPNVKTSRPSMLSRKNITIKVSLDGGKTWNEQSQINLDEEQGWGYSCLTLIDPETVGIVYEGSTAQMVFQRIKLKDIIKE